MRNHKFKFIITSSILFLSSLCCFNFLAPNLGEIISADALSNTIINTNTVEESRQYSYTGSNTGNIPFSIFTTAPSPTEGEFIITDYLPTFTATTSGTNTYYYSMNEDSVPYIVLSSTTPDDLFSKTLFFKFNDQNGATTSSTSEIVNMYVQGSVKTANLSDEIMLYCPINQNTASNSRYSFAVNLMPLISNDQANVDAECPFISSDITEKLGGNGAENDVSYRTGLYTFTISYTYKKNGIVSNACVFQMSFYIIDYGSYVESGENPLTFLNTDTYQYNDAETSLTYDTDYELYNYNHDDEPILEYDASKFGLNFSFTSGNNIYNFIYSSFTYNVPSGYTGKVTLRCVINNLTYQYSFYTKQSGSLNYKASFDFNDFQNNMIMPNSSIFKTNSFQGIYAFNMDILIPTNSSVNFIPIPSSTLDDTVESTLNCKKLAIFGYELKYTDYATSKRLSLVKYDSEGNLITKSSVIAKNDYSDYYVSIPNDIAITNQKNLRFDNFGNLTSSYTANYLLLDYNQISENEILNNDSNYFGLIKNSTSENLNTNLSTLDSLINAGGTTYTQGSPITVDGIYIMKLEYNISINLYISSEDVFFEGIRNVSGEQYIVFEVNNNIQKLKIQALNNNLQYLYDFNTYTNESVRVGIEDMPNAFFLPITVTYTRSANFSTTSSNSGTLTLKPNSTYLVDGVSYSYFAINSSNNFTFSQDGLYTVTIKIATTSTTSSETYTFYIDSDINKISSSGAVTNAQKISLNNATISTALKQDGKYVKTTDYIAKDSTNDLYITSSPFSLGWQPSASGAREYCYVSYMEEIETSNDLSLFKESSSEYWLTNSYEFSPILNNVENGYVNSFTLSSGSELSAKSYFRKDGIYFFFIYDQAGNYFYLTVIVDSSSSSILQGRWANTSENSQWINTYDRTNNEGNFVSNDTLLYFGTHKALLLPDLSTNASVTITNPSYSGCYNLTTGVPVQKNNFNLNFYQILQGFSSYIASNETSDLLDFGGSNASDSNYYLILKITSVTETTTNNTFTTPSTIYRSVIYNVSGQSVPFKGENNYVFTVTNKTGVTAERKINMSFDIVQGTFYAYNSVEEQYVITQGSGTNLNILKFTYTKNNTSTATYYEIKELYYQYYAFVLSENDPNYSPSSYPFSSSVTYQDSLTATPDEDGIHYSADSINVSYDSGLGLSGITKPGKYVITRVYQGGTHKRIDNGDGTFSFELEVGGDYYTTDGGETFIYLFSTDSKIRRYTVYVDHNDIISEKTSISEAVGDNISITLGSENSLTNQWTFKDFYEASLAGNSLTTNRVPVKINVPYSKYFLTNPSSYIFSNLNFAKLSVKIYYSSGTANKTYISNINTYNVATGMLTCSALASSSNINGDLIFSNEGRYYVVITDRTEKTPTSYSFSFYINYSSPKISLYTHSYSSSTFTDTLLSNEDNSNNYATNIKEKNDNTSLEDNKIYLKWNDPSTPYLAQIDKVSISVQNTDNTTSSYSIKLSALQKNTIISNLNGVVNLSLGTYDVNTLVSNQFVLSFRISYYNPSSMYEVFDDKNYYRYSYVIALSIKNEVTYTINVSYVSSTDNSESYHRNDDTSFADSTYTIKIDRTKPNTNINRLINSESLLTNYFSNTSEFKEENFDYEANGTLSKPSSLTYAFGVNNTFALSYNSNETQNYFYVRSYQKYNDEYSSITPDMIDTVYSSSHAYYENQLYFSGYPRFSEIRLLNETIIIDQETYYQTTYNSSISLYNQIKARLSIENPTGFYEIIEKDRAGNYRSFTVYFSNYTNTYQVLNVNGIHENGYTTMSGNAITATEYFTLSSLSSKLGWGYVSIRNETLGTNFFSTIGITPNSTSLSTQLINSINTFLNCEINSRFSFTLSRYNSSFPLSIIYVNVIKNNSTAFLSSPTVQESSSSTGTTYNLILPTSTTTTFLYLENFSLYVFTNNAWQATTHIYTSNVPRNITGLTKGIYKAVYKDNYNQSTYFFIIYIGEFYINDFSKEVVFEKNVHIVDNSTNVYYSGGNVQITYEANIYEVRVNGVKYSGTSFETLSSKFSSYNCKTFTLSSNYSYNNVDADSSVGGTTNYEIVYYDITDKSIRKTINITIFDYLPEILLTNENDRNTSITSTLEESDSQITNAIVNINYGTISSCAFEELNDSSSNSVTVAKLYTRNDNGEYVSYKIIYPGEVVSEEGYYRLDILNSKLGNIRSIYFVIQFGDFPLYTVYTNENEISPSTKEVFDLSSTNTANSSKLGSSGASQTIIKTIYDALTILRGNNFLTTVVDTQTSQPRTEYDILVKNLGFTGDVFNSSNIGIANILNVEHFYSIYSPTIVYNSNIKLNIIEFVFNNNILVNYYVENYGSNTTPSNVGRDYWTTIYLVYNLTGPIRIELFAFTKVPTSTSLISGNIYYNSTEVINLSASSISLEKVLTNNEVTNSTTTISWNMLPSAEEAKWFKQGNFVYMLDQYSLNNYYDPLNFAVNTTTKTNSSAITGSGTHKIMFKDIAGNTHQFTTSSFVSEKDVYKIHLLDQVIYYLTQNETNRDPIQYGIFNTNVNLTLDQYYLNMLSNVKIRVSINGISSTNFVTNGNVYTFSASGKYVVKLDAKYAGKDLKTATYNFTIINPNASKLSFEFPSISGYQITKVIKDSRNITSSVVLSDGSLFVNASDSNSGSGYYTVTLKYGKNATDIIEFSFLISDFVPTISSNVNYGETTTSDIVLSYNAGYIYNQIGECSINILVYNSDSNTFYTYQTISITSDALSTEGASSITISNSNSYFVQVRTVNGNVISSFRVNKTDPLNLFAIVAIIIASIAGIVLLIVIIKLRTKMRVR